MQDDFIGTVFGRERQLEVLGWNGERTSSGTKLYTVICRTCARDPELFGDAQWLMPQQHVKKGGIPCGCTPHCRYNSQQKMILIKRKCTELNFEYIGVATNLNRNRNYLNLKCLDHNESFSVTIERLFHRKVGCRYCKGDKISANKVKPEEIYIERFIATGKFIEGTLFKRLDSDYRRWIVFCPTCSNDKYGKQGLCNGEFEANRDTLSKGNRPCRCGIKKLTGQQILHDLNTFCEENNLKYKENSSKLLTKNSKITVECLEHGNFETTYYQLLQKGTRCKNCAIGGYKTDRDSILYVLKIEGFHDSFIGYGISGNFPKRFRQHILNTAEHGYRITEVTLYRATGEEILCVESLIKNSFDSHQIKITGFVKESTNTKNYNTLLDFCGNLIGDIVKLSAEELEIYYKTSRRI